VICDDTGTIILAATDVQPGDAVLTGGQLHHVRRVERRRGWSWPIASDSAGWAIALGEQELTVRRGVRHHDLPS
jgi:hypothetical protein